MKVNEALQILKKAGAVITEGRQTDHGYRWGGYMFNKGNKNTKYVKVLNLLYWSKRTHDEDDGPDGYTGLKKKWVHDMMNWPTDHGNHSSMWTELGQEGYVKYDKSNQTWSITNKGSKFLEDNDLVIPYNELTDAINGSDEPAEEKAPSKNILDILLQSLVIVSRSNAGEISVEDLADQTALRHYDVEEGLLELQRQELADTDWNDEDGEENLWFITGRGALVLRNTDKIPVKGTTISDVASGRAEYEGAPAAKKPAIDLDDDIYDDTPVVKQRDESFAAFAKKNGYQFVNEDTDDWDEADMPVGHEDMATAHNERGKGAFNRFRTTSPKGRGWNDRDYSGKRLFWLEFIKKNFPSNWDNYHRNRYRMKDIIQPEEGGLWIVKFTYQVLGWWGLDFDFDVTFKANDKAEIVGDGIAYTEYRDEPLKTTVKNFIDMDKQILALLKKKLGGGYA